MCRILVVLYFVCTAICSPLPAASVEELVEALGQRDEHDVQRIQQMAGDPARAAAVLIRQLHVVKPTRVLASEKDRDTERVLWSIRALRYLTGGKDFCAVTTYKFGSSELETNRKYWLTLNGRACLPFFAMWTSRGSDYVAPPDVQAKIIEQWRKWLATDARSFVYHPLTESNQDWIP